MVKRILNLYVDDELIQLAKGRGIIMSRFFSNVLESELELLESPQEDRVRKLQIVNAKLSSQITDLTNELNKFKKQLEDCKKNGKTTDEVKPGYKRISFGY